MTNIIAISAAAARNRLNDRPPIFHEMDTPSAQPQASQRSPVTFAFVLPTR